MIYITSKRTLLVAVLTNTLGKTQDSPLLERNQGTNIQRTIISSNSLSSKNSEKKTIKYKFCETVLHIFLTPYHFQHN